MKTLKYFWIFVVFLLCSFSRISYSQDSSKIIILHKKIGAVVDLNEKEEYGILPEFKNENFISAVFYQGDDSLFYCKIKEKEGSTVKDTTLLLNYNSLINTAVRIQFIENRRLGLSSINFQDVKLKFANNEEVKNNTGVKTNISHDEYNYYNQNLARLQSRFSKKLLPINRKKLNYSELLKKSYRFGLSIGIKYNSAKYKGFKNLFNFIEKEISTPEYIVPLSDYSSKASTLFDLSSSFVFEKNYFIELEYSFNITNSHSYESLNYREFNLSVGYQYNYTEMIVPYVVISGAGLEIKAKNDYGIGIDSVGGFLDSITLTENSFGVKISAGVLISLSPSTQFDIRIGYKNFPKETLINNTNINTKLLPKVNADGFEAGIKIYFY